MVYRETQGFGNCFLGIFSASVSYSSNRIGDLCHCPLCKSHKASREVWSCTASVLSNTFNSYLPCLLEAEMTVRLSVPGVFGQLLSQGPEHVLYFEQIMQLKME